MNDLQSRKDRNLGRMLVFGITPLSFVWVVLAVLVIITGVMIFNSSSLPLLNIVLIIVMVIGVQIVARWRGWKAWPWSREPRP